MRRFLPSKFGWREKLLSVLAVVMAIVAGWLSCFLVGMGVAVAWIFFTVVGTVVFAIIAGSGRCFFTALFTVLLSGREQKETGGSSKGDKGSASRNCPFVEGLRRPERSERRLKPVSKGQRA